MDFRQTGSTHLCSECHRPNVEYKETGRTGSRAGCLIVYLEERPRCRRNDRVDVVEGEQQHYDEQPTADCSETHSKHHDLWCKHAGVGKLLYQMSDCIETLGNRFHSQLPSIRIEVCILRLTVRPNVLCSNPSMKAIPFGHPALGQLSSIGSWALGSPV